MNTLTKLYLVTCFSLCLTACGGGGGGGGSSSPSAGSSGAATPTLQDLKIDKENTLESVYHLSVDVDLADLDGKQAYIAICDNSAGEANIDYDQCLIKASLKQGSGQFDLRVANHCDSLVAVVSVMEQGVPVRYYQHQHDGQAETVWYIQ